MGGGRLRFHQPLRVGDAASKVSRILDVSAKTGRSGSLAFVTVEHKYYGSEGLAITEEHDIVYRENASPNAPTPGGSACAQAYAGRGPGSAAPEPSFLDGLLANPMLLPGGGLLVALLGGYAIYRRRQQQKTADGGAFGDSVLSQESTVMAGANSLFGAAGGQSVDTSQHSVFGADFRIGNNMPEASEVDPIAEAEVYIAYGRDVQAEEILREALEKDPEQQPIRLKLLEIYSNRQDVEGFRVIAEEMFAQTGGQGAEWLKAAEMGRALDAGNALYMAVTPDASGGPETATALGDQWRTQDPSHDPAVAPREASLADLALPLDAFPAPAAGDPIVAPASAGLVFGDGAVLEPAAKFDDGLDLTLPATGDDALADVPRLHTDALAHDGFRHLGHLARLRCRIRRRDAQRN